MQDRSCSQYLSNEQDDYKIIKKIMHRYPCVFCRTLYQQSPNHVICSSHLPVQQVLHAKCQGSALCVLRTGETDLTSEILIPRAV